MEIIRAEVLNKDEVIWVVKMDGKDIHENPDAHALAHTLDTMRIRGVYKG